MFTWKEFAIAMAVRNLIKKTSNDKKMKGNYLIKEV
jgi:hypothetical protein